MTVSSRSDAPAASRNAAAKRTSDSTVMAARLATKNLPAPVSRPRVSLLPSSCPPLDQRQHPLTPTETKSEQVRLLALLRGLHPIHVVDQLCRALSFFGGIPGAPAPPSGHDFPLSMAANGPGSLFVGWLSEIFPKLASSTTGRLGMSAPKRARGRPKGMKTSRMRSSLVAYNSRNLPARPQSSTHIPTEIDADDSWVDVDEPCLNLVPSGSTTHIEPCVVPTDGSNPDLPPIRSLQPPSNEPQPSKRRRGRPKGSKNRPKGQIEPAIRPSDPANELLPPLARKGRGRPKGSKNKPKEGVAATGAENGRQKAGRRLGRVDAGDSAPSDNASSDLQQGQPVNALPGGYPDHLHHGTPQQIPLDAGLRPSRSPDTSGALTMTSTPGHSLGTATEAPAPASTTVHLAPAVVRRSVPLVTEFTIAGDDGHLAKRQKTAAGPAQGRRRQQLVNESDGETALSLNYQAQISRPGLQSSTPASPAFHARGSRVSPIAHPGRSTALVMSRSAGPSKQPEFQQPAGATGQTSPPLGIIRSGEVHHSRGTSTRQRPDQAQYDDSGEQYQISSATITVKDGPNRQILAGPTQARRAVRRRTTWTRSQASSESRANQRLLADPAAVGVAPSQRGARHLVASTSSIAPSAAPSLDRQHRIRHTYAKDPEMPMLNEFPNPNLAGLRYSDNSRHGQEATDSALSTVDGGILQRDLFDFGGNTPAILDESSTDTGSGMTHIR